MGILFSETSSEAGSASPASPVCVQQKNETANLEEREELGSNTDLHPHHPERSAELPLLTGLRWGAGWPKTARDKKKDFPGGTVDKNLSAETGPGFDPGRGRSQASRGNSLHDTSTESHLHWARGPRQEEPVHRSEGRPPLIATHAAPRTWMK